MVWCPSTMCVSRGDVCILGGGVSTGVEDELRQSTPMACLACAWRSWASARFQGWGGGCLVCGQVAPRSVWGGGEGAYQPGLPGELVSRSPFVNPAVQCADHVH